ncbi:acetate/propionate family kinase [Sphingomonas sp. PB2P19]|uniref:acetate/propionate family kinase n=1 Tax=Sphingomonas rhamnosi TaxID=3096156 RepID=UPI002FCAF281
MTGAPPTIVLTFNGGSSSLKFGLFDVSDDTATPLLTGQIETLGGDAVQLRATDARGQSLADHRLEDAAPSTWTQHVVDLLDRAALPDAQVIGHRLVHGGPHLSAPVRIDDAVLHRLEAARGFAPLHIPEALATIRAAQAHFPDRPQVACFDTHFHAAMPAVAKTLPIPAMLRDTGLHRYGFHGLSCESIVRQLGADLPERLIIAHLGNGASVTAVRGGRSVDTSMGLTPTGGIIMGRRSGDLDPGLLLHLMREHGYTAETLETLLDHQSGLLGISGIDSDMRRLKEAAPTHAEARLAIAMFCRALGKTIAAMAHVLSGVDLIVFSGGIGEHDPGVRATVGADLAWAGVTIDAARNRGGEGRISADHSVVTVRIVPAQEDAEIARHAARVMTCAAERIAS